MQSETQEATIDQAIDITRLKNITIREAENGFAAALVDEAGFEMVRGFGSSPTAALNDLHRNLI